MLQEEPTFPIPMGTALSPRGHEITVDRCSLRRDGEPWLPVMGEFHYTRSPEAEWCDGLLKMRAGGIDIVSTYIFWIHHEESEGEWDWAGRRDLRAFVTLCGSLGLSVVVRLGPWCHGEVRNGGFPDWLVHKGCKLRCDDPPYLGYAASLYGQAADQLRGLLWKDGGPVVGVQIENEYAGPAEHLLSLKRLAVGSGLDVPLYTRTGWPGLSTPMPPGELVPLFGGYPDGFWDRTVAEMPPGYRGAFLFTRTRADAAIATDQLGERATGEDPEDARYPYFACEIGGGMERSYHRRIRIAPRDIAALALVKLGSGNNLQGYYMYHGGSNPEGRLSTLQESQATGYWNDVPVSSYDFQAPLGEFGQVRPHYHWLRRLHLFLRDFGSRMASMPMALPDTRPSSPDDTETLRWSARTDGRSGFVFVNNYQRLQPMPAKPGAQFGLCLVDSCLSMPLGPLTVPADSAFFWPFHLDLGGIPLTYATAQPVCRLEDGGVNYVVFAQTDGIPTEFVFDAPGLSVESANGEVTGRDGLLRVQNVRPGTGPALRLRTGDGRRLCVVLLDEDDSLACWKGTLAGRERLFLTRAALLPDDKAVRLRATDTADLSVALFPAPPVALWNGSVSEGTDDGLFRRFGLPTPPAPPVEISWKRIRPAGPPRRVATGGAGVAEAPSDADFSAAAVWQIHLPADTDPARRLRLRIRYAGDIARVVLNGVLLTDNFYNGDAFEVGLTRDAPGVYAGELLLKILPLRRDAPIYLPADAWPEFGGQESVTKLFGIDAVEESEATLTLTAEPHRREAPE